MTRERTAGSSPSWSADRRYGHLPAAVRRCPRAERCGASRHHTSSRSHLLPSTVIGFVRGAWPVSAIWRVTLKTRDSSEGSSPLPWPPWPPQLLGGVAGAWGCGIALCCLTWGGRGDYGTVLFIVYRHGHWPQTKKLAPPRFLKSNFDFLGLAGTPPLYYLLVLSFPKSSTRTDQAGVSML